MDGTCILFSPLSNINDGFIWFLNDLHAYEFGRCFDSWKFSESGIFAWTHSGFYVAVTSEMSVKGRCFLSNLGIVVDLNVMFSVN